MILLVVFHAYEWGCSSAFPTWSDEVCLDVGSDPEQIEKRLDAAKQEAIERYKKERPTPAPDPDALVPIVVHQVLQLSGEGR